MSESVAALKHALAVIARGAPLAAAEAEAAFAAILDGDASDPAHAARLGGFAIGLAARGETATEIVAGARALRARAAAIPMPPELAGQLVDTCGTGGDGAATFNISTAAALIAAGAGAVVAKHGGRAVSSRSGSADVLRALGVPLEASAAAAPLALTEAGVAFLFAPAHHAAMADVAPARQALGARTIFNLIGPLTNPAGARRQLLGVWTSALLVPMAEALRELGAERAWVVHGADGLDELTTTGPSRVAALDHGRIDSFEVTPEDAGLPRATLSGLRGGDAAENAAALRAVLNGEGQSPAGGAAGGALSAYRDIAVLNAGAALVVAGRAGDLREGVGKAIAALESGAAARALESLVRVTAATAARAAETPS